METYSMYVKLQPADSKQELTQVKVKVNKSVCK